MQKKNKSEYTQREEKVARSEFDLIDVGIITGNRKLAKRLGETDASEYRNRVLYTAAVEIVMGNVGQEGSS